jgi:hypothetical protein
VYGVRRRVGNRGELEEVGAPGRAAADEAGRRLESVPIAVKQADDPLPGRGLEIREDPGQVGLELAEVGLHDARAGLGVPEREVGARLLERQRSRIGRPRGRTGAVARDGGDRADEEQSLDATTRR